MTNKKTTLDKKNALSALGNADSLAQGEAMRNFWAQCAGPDLMDAFKLPPAAQRLQSVMDEAAAWQRKEDIKQVFGALLAEQARKESEELQLAIEREEFNRIERDEMARLSARAKWQASQQAEQAAKVAPAPAPAPATDAATPAPVTGSASNAPTKKWTPERLAELKAFRASHTMPETAKKFGISEQRIRELLPSNNPKSKGYSAFTYRSK